MSSTQFDTSLDFPPPFDAFVADLDALGVRPVSSGGERFTVVAARSNPRWWLTPLDHGEACARAGLDMLQPFTRAAKLAKVALRMRARYGNGIPMTGRKIRLSGAPSFFAAFDLPGLCCAYFTGTDGPHRKTAAQIMTAAGDIVGYAKFSRNPLVKPFLENEARFLAELAGLDPKSAIVPKLVEHRDQGGIARLVTDSLRAPGHVVAHRLGSAHHAFLSELVQKTRRPGSAGTLAELAGTLKTLGPALSDDWSTRLAAGIARIEPRIETLPVALAHGDFTPWNTFIVGDRLYVFDWEYAHPAYPLGFDLVHFTLSANLSAPVPALLDQVETDVATHFYHGNRAEAARAVLLSLLLHAVFYLNRAAEAGETERDWGEAERRARMIDALLDRIEG